MEEGTLPEFAVALSGGGHRATLATVGSLMALVDRGLNEQVVQIASVSGGSITSAFIGQRCDYRTVDSERMDAIAADLTTRVMKGALTTPWIVALGLGPALAGALLAVAIAGAVGVLAAALVGIAVAVTVMTGAGLGVQHLLRRRYLADTAGGRNPTIDTMGERTVEHVFCATDLVHGSPVYVSTWDGGILWRRIGLLDVGRGMRLGQRWDASCLTIAEVVRASAAFPGIPPRRLSFGRRSRLRYLPPPPLTFGGTEPAGDSQTNMHAANVAFLADGGMWNNLGTQVIREDSFFRGDKVGGPRIVFGINGSAPLAPGSSWRYHVPGLSIITALVRGTKVLNANTVGPRARAMQNDTFLRSRHDPKAMGIHPVTIIANLATDPAFIEASVRSLAHDRDELQRANLEHRSWTLEFSGLSIEWSTTLAAYPEISAAESSRLVGQVVSHLEREPLHYGPYPGLVGHFELDAVLGSPVWAELRELADGPVAVPTTLGPIPPEDAVRLLARGYLSTYLLSLLVKGGDSSPELLDPLVRVKERLASLVAD